MIDVSQVLQFPSAKFDLLKQLPINKITQPFIPRWALNGRSAYSITQGFQKENSIKEGYVLKTRVFDAGITGT